MKSGTLRWLGSVFGNDVEDPDPFQEGDEVGVIVWCFVTTFNRSDELI